MRARLAAGVTAFAVIAAVASPAGAKANDPSVRLAVSQHRLTFGHKVELSGAVSPPSAGQTVTIVDAHGRIVETAVTDANGKYAVTLRPHHNLKVRATWTAAVSAPHEIDVMPAVQVDLGRVRLFHRVSVDASIKPPSSDSKVVFQLIRPGSSVAVRKRHGNDEHVSAHFNVTTPGRYTARVVVRMPTLTRAAQRSRPRSTPTPYLSSGSRGPYVKALEKRLIALGYYLPRADRRYDQKTYDAVIAFNKVQGRERVGSVNAGSWAKLANPLIPHPRETKPSSHIEIDQTRQVIFVVRNGKVKHILATSTGANGYTHDGRYHVYRKLAGTSAGGLYYPSYFDDRRAIHGWPDVPPYAASHGCSRIPMWAATWMYTQSDIGTEVLVYH
ncbi:MAG: L,D-transpeptidase family protein [Actinomycetota bacterium]|nr:L,D-transpeptidase family protein [Actinomycetota bacterium]